MPGTGVGLMLGILAFSTVSIMASNSSTIMLLDLVVVVAVL